MTGAVGQQRKQGEGAEGAVRSPSAKWGDAPPPSAEMSDVLRSSSFFFFFQNRMAHIEQIHNNKKTL